jgi:hypothetical protein
MAERTFRRRRGGLVNLVYLDIDDRAARELRGALAKRRFDVAEQTIAGQRDANERQYYLEAASDWRGPAPFLRDWAARGSATGRLAAAIHGLKRSWDHSPWTRGPNDLQRFQAEVRAASEQLASIAKASPRDAVPLYWMIWAARGLREATRARELYDEAVRRDPTVLANHAAALWTESPSWFGSESAMLEHARRVASEGPGGIGADALIVEAHWVLAQGPRNPRWTLPDVRAEVLEADARDRAAPATGIARVRADHWFAYGLWAIGEAALARDRFAAIGRTPTELPWGVLRFGLDGLLGDFGRARRACARA